MDSRELPTERLSTTDEQGRRIYVQPADVRGPWRNLRTVVSAALMVVFVILPWVRIGGRQAVWLDLANRKFTLFGFLFWAHDAPGLVFLFGGFAVGLAFVTAVWGRVWCGYACPQTVFVDLVFRRIERWIEGDHIARRALDAAPMTTSKVARRALKWALFAAASLVISHSFVAYFTGTDALGRMMVQSPSANWGTFLAVLFFAGAILFDFGWFREQFCTIVCPYGRLQSVLMDDHSQVVLYDAKRGEPRKGTTAAGALAGDCVNCFRCVAVCPTGIDIRRGVQMECIACTACIDACDEIMDKVHKPRGLIRYGRIAKQAFTARAGLYLAILAVLGTGFVLWARGHEPLDLELVRAVGSPYQEVTDAANRSIVINHFHAELSNQDFEDQDLEAIVQEPWKSRGVELVVSNFQAHLTSGQRQRSDFFFKVPKTEFNGGRGAVQLLIRARSPGRTTEIQKEVPLIGPYR